VEASPRGLVWSLCEESRGQTWDSSLTELPRADLLSGTVENSPAKQLHKNTTTLLRLVSFVPYSALERLSCVSVQSEKSRCYPAPSLQQANRFGEAQAGCRGKGAVTLFPCSWALDTNKA